MKLCFNVSLSHTEIVRLQNPESQSSDGMMMMSHMGGGGVLKTSEKIYIPPEEQRRVCVSYNIMISLSLTHTHTPPSLPITHTHYLTLPPYPSNSSIWLDVFLDQKA